MLVKNLSISCLSPVCFKNPPHIIPAFVLTQLLQSKLAQIKPHPFSNHFSHLRFTCVSRLVDWFEIVINLFFYIVLELSSCQWLAIISWGCGRCVLRLGRKILASCFHLHHQLELLLWGVLQGSHALLDLVLQGAVRDPVHVLSLGHAHLPAHHYCYGLLQDLAVVLAIATSLLPRLLGVWIPFHIGGGVRWPGTGMIQVGAPVVSCPIQQASKASTTPVLLGQDGSQLPAQGVLPMATTPNPHCTIAVQLRGMGVPGEIHPPNLGDL